MKSLPYKKLITLLEHHNFVISRQKGSHVILKQKQTGRTVAVPQHGKNTPIPIGTFLAILKQAGIPKKDVE